MLRKTAKEEGKNWDKLLPYVLFAYREVPQASTGFSPFELLYGRRVRGPLDVLREIWESSSKSSESIVSYVINMREKMDRMIELVQENFLYFLCQSTESTETVVRQERKDKRVQERRSGVSAATDVEQQAISPVAGALPG